MGSNKNCISKKLVTWLVIASIVVIMLIGVTFCIFIYKEKNKGERFFDSGSIVMTYSENSDIFFVNNMISVSDDAGRVSSDEDQYFDFTIKVNLGDSKSANYEIALEVNEEFTTVLPSDVMIYLEKQESGTYVPISDPISFDELDLTSDYGASSVAKIITKGSCDETTSYNYRLRMWLKEGTVTIPEIVPSFAVEINVYGETK